MGRASCPVLLAFAGGLAVGWVEGAWVISPHPSFVFGFLSPACSHLRLPPSFLLCTPSSLQQPHHYCRWFIFRVKATELQIRQGLKQIDKRKVFVFEAVWMRGLLAGPVKKLLSWLVFRVAHVGCLILPSQIRKEVETQQATEISYSFLCEILPKSYL